MEPRGLSSRLTMVLYPLTRMSPDHALGTRVNKGMKKGRGCCYAPASFSRVGLPLPLLLPWRSIRRLTRLANRLHALLGT